MKTLTLPMITLLLLGIGGACLAEDDPAKQLAEVNAKIKNTPDNPMLHYKKAQCLMKLQRREEGHATAKQAMKLFVQKNNDLAWMLLEHVELENVVVDIHFNMGPRERRPPDIGIVRPLSFRVWQKPQGKRRGPLLEIIDFEIGTFGGAPSTAALGMTTGGAHANFGILDPESTYEQIREEALELIKGRHGDGEESD